jgi:hypothetical protein
VQAVCNGEDGTLNKGFSNSFLDEIIGLNVNGGCGLRKRNEQGWLSRIENDEKKERRRPKEVGIR